MSGATTDHCYYCFDSIHATLTNTPQPSPTFDGRAEYPLFVTWNIQSRTNGTIKLKGCIGGFSSAPLGKGLQEYARISAFKDHRFQPIVLKDLSRLHCGVSLLMDFEIAYSHLDWTLGVHGIYIEFVDPDSNDVVKSNGQVELFDYSDEIENGASFLLSRPCFPSIDALPPFTSTSTKGGRLYSATYLPDVPPAQGWSKVETIDSAIEKSGYKKVITEALRRSCRVTRYQSSKCEVSYSDWMAARA